MRKLVLLAIITVIACATSFAQEVTAPAEVTTTTAPATSAKSRFDIGAGYWYTSGSYKWDVIAPEDLYDWYYLQGWYYGFVAEKGDKISELDFDTDTGLFIVNAEAYLFWRLYADAFIGWSDIDGEVEDSDWYPQVLPDLMHYSKSDAEGDVTTWNINGYFRIIEEKEDKGYLDVSLGYFSYVEDIDHIKNGTQILYYWETINEPLVGLDSSSKLESDGVRFGLRGKIRLHDRVAIKASGGIVPWLDVENPGYWNLREMKMDKTAEGTAFDINIGLEVKITQYLFIEAGYKYINIDSDLGDDTRTWADGTELELKDSFEAEASRGGFYAMGRLKI